MAERRAIIAGNWKLHNDIASAVSLAKDVARLTTTARGVDVVVGPVFTALHAVSKALEDSHVAVAAQNCYFEEKGAFTGEVAPGMLADAGCRYIIVGHSERRTIFGESDDLIARKVKAVYAAELLPIICVGETEQERDAGQTHEVVSRQVRAALSGLSAEQVQVGVIAYEPVWAIGTGRTATAEQAQEVHHAIRALVGELCGDAAAAAVRIQYGGSVKPANVDALMACPDIDGALVGGASLDAESFARIVKFESPS